LETQHLLERGKGNCPLHHRKRWYLFEHWNTETAGISFTSPHRLLEKRTKKAAANRRLRENPLENPEQLKRVALSRTIPKFIRDWNHTKSYQFFIFILPELPSHFQYTCIMSAALTLQGWALTAYLKGAFSSKNCRIVRYLEIFVKILRIMRQSVHVSVSSYTFFSPG